MQARHAEEMHQMKMDYERKHADEIIALRQELVAVQTKFKAIKTLSRSVSLTLQIYWNIKFETWMLLAKVRVHEQWWPPLNHHSGSEGF